MMISSLIIVTRWNVLCSFKFLFLWMGMMDVLCNNEMFVEPWVCFLYENVLWLFKCLLMATINALYEYRCMGENKIVENLKWFMKIMREVFVLVYLWQSTWANLKWQLHIKYVATSFLGMFTSFDYIHCRWKKCSNA
jgi:hypothetical protein